MGAGGSTMATSAMLTRSGPPGSEKLAKSGPSGFERAAGGAEPSRELLSLFPLEMVLVVGFTLLLPCACDLLLPPPSANISLLLLFLSLLPI